MMPIQEMAAEMSCRLGIVCLKLKDTAMATNFLTKALEYDAQHEKAIIVTQLRTSQQQEFSVIELLDLFLNPNISGTRCFEINRRSCRSACC